MDRIDQIGKLQLECSYLLFCLTADVSTFRNNSTKFRVMDLGLFAAVWFVLLVYLASSSNLWFSQIFEPDRTTFGNFFWVFFFNDILKTSLTNIGWTFDS